MSDTYEDLTTYLKTEDSKISKAMVLSARMLLSKHGSRSEMKVCNRELQIQKIQTMVSK